MPAYLWGMSVSMCVIYSPLFQRSACRIRLCQSNSSDVVLSTRGDTMLVGSVADIIVLLKHGVSSEVINELRTAACTCSDARSRISACHTLCEQVCWPRSASQSLLPHPPSLPHPLRFLLAYCPTNPMVASPPPTLPTLARCSAHMFPVHRLHDMSEHGGQSSIACQLSQHVHLRFDSAQLLCTRIRLYPIQCNPIC